MKKLVFFRKVLASVLSLVITFSTLLVGFPSLHFFNVVSPTNAASLNAGSVSLNNATPSASAVSYTIDWGNVSTDPIQCIKVVFSTAASGGSTPTGLSVVGATFSATSDYIPTPASWTVATSSGTLQMTYGSGETPASASNRTVVITGMTNGSTTDTAYYIQFNTYNNTDCSSSAVDSGTAAFIYTAAQTVSTTVDPSLTFTVNAVANNPSYKEITSLSATSTATTIPLGRVTSSATNSAAQDLTVGTNATGGYTVYVRTTSTTPNPLRSPGGDSITDVGGSNATPADKAGAGTEGFGYSTNDSSLGTGTADRFSGNNTWAALTGTNSEVAYSATPVSETTRVGYAVTVTSTTEAGDYTATIIYTATPTY